MFTEIEANGSRVKRNFASAFLILSLLWAVFALPGALPIAQSQYPENETYPMSGESLLHSLSKGPAHAAISQHLPLSNTLIALSSTHYGKEFSDICLWAMGALWLALMFAAGALLGSWRTGLAACALWVVSLSLNTKLFSLESQSVFAPLVFLVGGFLIWEAHAASVFKRILLGLAIGVCIFYRSPLAFFPPVYFALNWFSQKQNAKAPRYSLFIVLLLPYVFLIPWIKTNWTLLGGFVPLEHRQTHANVATGAMGLPMTIEGDWRDFVKGPVPGDEFSSFAPWVLKEVFSHPLRYLWAYISRVGFVFYMQPFFAFGALLAFLLAWRKKEMRAVGFLAVFFMGIHCFMSVEEDYFRPLVPLLILMTASLAAMPSEKIKPPLFYFAGGVFHAFLGFLLIPSLWAAYLVWIYPAHSADREWASIAESEAPKHPKEAWMRAQSGRKKLREENFKEASQDFSQALRAWPGHPDYETELWGALAFQGHTRALLKETPVWADTPPLPVEVRRFALRAAVYFKDGKFSKGKENLEAAINKWKEYGCMVRAMNTPFQTKLDEAAYEKLACAKNGGFAQELLERYLADYPQQQRLPVLKALLEIYPAADPTWPGLTMRLVEGAQYDSARLIILCQAELNKNSEELPVFISALKKFPAPQRLVLLLRLLEINPKNKFLWIENALENAQEKNWSAARSSLLRLAALQANAQEWMRLNHVFKNFPASSRAGLMKELIQNQKDQPFLWIESAAAHARNKNIKQAALDLKQARVLNMPEDLKHDSALKLQDAGVPAMALELFEELIRHSPQNAVYHSDKGVCAFLAGNKEEAQISLKRALELNPAYLPAQLSLAALTGHSK